MSGRDPHIPIQHARSVRTRALDNELVRIGAREPLLTNDPVLQGLADLVADIDLVVDRIAPAAAPLLVEVPTTGTTSVLPADDTTGDTTVRPLVRRRQTWSVLTATGIAASFVAASLLSSSSPPAPTTPSLMAAAETKDLLTHATKILPSATASNAARVEYAKELAADLTHAAALLPQVQDPQAHASLATQLARLQQQAPPPSAPPPPSARPSGARPSAGAAPQRPASGAARAVGPGQSPSTAAQPTGQQTVIRSAPSTPAQPPVPHYPAQPRTGQQPLPGSGQAGAGTTNGAGTGAQQPPPGQAPPRLTPDDPDIH